MDFLPCVEKTLGHDVDAAVIWLHGLGADGHDFEPVVDQLGVTSATGMRFLFPHAPVQPVTLNAGYEMRSWFDLYSLKFDEKLDLLGIRRSAEAIDALIAREQERGVASERIILAGFSQGGALAMYCALRYPKRLAGAIGLSTFFPFNSALDSERSAANAGLSIFIGHGLVDPTVNYMFGVQTKTLLSGLGYPVEFHDYSMAHSVCPEEIEAIGKWINRILA